MHEYSAQSNETLFKEFEEKILACNGEIERVISQCNDAIVSILFVALQFLMR